MRIISVILLFICGSLLFQTWQTHQQTEAYALVEEDLNKQIEEEQERKQSLEDMSEYLNSDAYIEDMAREKLGLVYDNEIIFKKQGR
jgi:cell division protein DivIC